MEVSYGDKIHLWARSAYAPGDPGGYVGIYDNYKRKGRLCCIPPHHPRFTNTYFPSTFTVTNPERANDTGPLKYGMTVVLVDENGLVWNNRINKDKMLGIMGQRERGEKGECFVKFVKSGFAGSAVCIGHDDISIEVVKSNRFRSFYNKRITNINKSGMHKGKKTLSGGYLTSDGRGEGTDHLCCAQE